MKSLGLISLILLFLISCETKQQDNTEVSFYFSAHPDDWQLFMGLQAYEDINQTDVKTVFFLTTAGDAAMGMGASERATMPYFKARERGYINALIWAGMPVQIDENTSRAQRQLSDYQLETVSVRGHEIKKFENDQLTAYLFYLPDGFPDGQYTWSLQKLYHQEIENMPTIDSTTFYKDWRDLELTVKELIDTEAKPGQPIRVNLAERDVVLNPGDHSDHVHTSMLGELASQHLGPKKRYYREYVMAEMDTNLSAEQSKLKRYLFSANALSKEKAGYASPWNDHHLAWVAKSYWREADCR